MKDTKSVATPVKTKLAMTIMSSHQNLQINTTFMVTRLLCVSTSSVKIEHHSVQIVHGLP